MDGLLVLSIIAVAINAAPQGLTDQNTRQFIPNGQFFPPVKQFPGNEPQEQLPQQQSQQNLQPKFTLPVTSAPFFQVPLQQQQFAPQQVPLQQQLAVQQLPPPQLQQQQRPLEVAPQTPQTPEPSTAPAQSIDPTEDIATSIPPQQATLSTATPTPQIISPPVDKNVDLDSDGILSLSEVQYAAFVHHGLSSSVIENMFHQVDKNQDGYLNALEFNEIRPLVLAKAENAALRYLNNVDQDRDGLLSLKEAQAYILKEYGISNRDVERIWRLVVPSNNDEMDAVLFSKLRRRVRGMSIRLARQIMKNADINEDGHIDLREAQAIAFEQEGIGAGDVVEMFSSVDDNNDGLLSAPEFADFERIVRAKAVETSKKALKVVDTDGSNTLTMNEARRIAFDHYGFDERTLEPFFAQADENEDGQLNYVEFAGFRSVIRGRAVKNAIGIMPEVDIDGDGLVSTAEAEDKTRREDDMDAKETNTLYSVADQDKSGALDKVELADFVRLVRLSAIKYAADHFKEFDVNRDNRVTLDELQSLIQEKYNLDPVISREFFDKVDVDFSGDLNAGEIVDFRHEVRKFVTERTARQELENQHRREMAEIEARLRKEKEEKASRQPAKTKHIAPARDQSAAEESEESDTTTLAPTTTIKHKKRLHLRKQKTTTTTTTEAPTTEAEEIESEEQTLSSEETAESNDKSETVEVPEETIVPEQATTEEEIEATTPSTLRIVTKAHPTETAESSESESVPATTEEIVETTEAFTEEATKEETTQEPTTTTASPRASVKKTKKHRTKTTTHEPLTTTSEPEVTTEGTTTEAATTAAPEEEPATTEIVVETTEEPQTPTTEASESETTAAAAVESEAPAFNDEITSALPTTSALPSTTEAQESTEEQTAETTTAPPTTTAPSTRTHKRKRLRIKTTTTTVAPQETTEGEEH